MTSNEDYCLYEVKPGDSLSAIAAHFGHITPTQLARINRLSVMGTGLPPVFPGQKILVPTSSTSRVTVPRHRPAPGSALRINVSSVGSGLDDLGYPRSLLRSTLNFSDSLEDSEKQFVKVNSRRKLSSGDYIEGILLLTPDCLCFDAAPITHKQALHSDTSVSAESSSESQEAITSEEATHFSICLPLKQISSMSTARISNIQDVCRSVSESEPPTELFDSPQKTVLTQTMSKSVALESDSTGSLTIHAKDETNGLFPPASEATQPPGMAIESHIEKAPDCLPEPSEIAEYQTDVTSPNEGSPQHAGSPKTVPPSYANSLQLHLTEFAEKGETPREHCFIVTIEDIPAVFAFLLDLGVQSMQEKRTFSYSTSPSSKKHKKSSGSMDSASGHRSMIEEALEDLDNTASLVPTTLGGESGILTDEMLTELGENFPTHWIGANMRLVYRADQDGYSLGTMYRKSRDLEDGVVLLIRDTMNTVFGAILSEAPHCSQHFYGTGETCVFHWSPSFKRYDWTKKNYYFMLGSANSFQIGGQSGHNAIWIDEALKYGRSEPTDTFDNPVLSGCLPAFQVDIPVAPDALPTDGNTFEANSAHLSDYCTQAPGLDSVPFVIDTLEIWELVC